jgi:ribosomal protein S18 acetylase RimI-like enzyme
MASDIEGPNYYLRAATDQDAAFIYALRKAGLQTYVAQLWGWDEAGQVARFREHFDPRRYQVIVVAGRDVGAVAIEWRADDVLLADIEIIPAWRGRGLGSRIINMVLEEARRQGLPVSLQVLKGNPARHLYERLGFRVVEETESHYRMSAEGRVRVHRSQSIP